MVGLIITVIVTVLVTIIWANAIDKMKNEYPDYKGDDFLDWDDNKNHTEDKL